ncbi:MAG: pseudaminic acid cytidylyltransferase, partial [Lachnospiraceae bacterium]|nr:pseudaminic acid cytidylyltransferase [Lachnospiraceae bacterium]
MSVIAIITARGGSKRIPGKNIRNFLGKPIIAYSIEAALQSGIFDEVMVSTDSEEIASIAAKYGAAVPFFRSEENAGDYAATADVIREVILQYQERGKQYDWLCCLYPTAPFVTADVLREAYQQTQEPGTDAVVPVVKFSFPVQRSFIVEEDGKLAYKWPQYRTARSQDLEPFYHDAGQFYYERVEAFLSQNTMVPENTRPYI